MKKAIIILFVVIMLLLMLTGCLPNYVQVTGYYGVYHILDANMPYADTMNSVQFDTVKKLEVDSFGRSYYSYITYSTAFQHELEIHVICQKETKKEIYYYSDFCYIARKSDGDAFSDEDIARFKENNDWNKPLNEKKMRQIPNDFQDNIITETDLKTILRDYLCLEESDDLILNNMEINDSDQQMFFCQVCNMSEGDQQKRITTDYILIYQNSSLQPIVVIEEFEPTLDCQEFMHSFRATYFEREGQA